MTQPAYPWDHPTIQAMATLVLEALAKNAGMNGGAWTLAIENMTLNGVSVGDWHLQLSRTKAP